jgi:hypothetical protein
MSKSKSKSKTILAILVVLSCGGFGSCSERLNGNTGFDLWCGDSLCTWTVEAGDVQRVPTWHEKDLAADLIGSYVAISQPLSLDGRTCLEIDTLSATEANAQLSLEADFGDDGTVDWSGPISSAPDWASDSITIPTPSAAPSVRVRLTKTGDGRAQIAQLVVWDNCL